MVKVKRWMKAKCSSHMLQAPLALVAMSNVAVMCSAGRNDRTVGFLTLSFHVVGCLKEYPVVELLAAWLVSFSVRRTPSGMSANKYIGTDLTVVCEVEVEGTINSISGEIESHIVTMDISTKYAMELQGKQPESAAYKVKLSKTESYVSSPPHKTFEDL
ncbi:unnamed protein product [Mytilus coruscus]|uniref:Uncharacterized protein n=1 Tax=Mytilus coruscus TaxID=42192 RepID=A0A6J8F2G0_MYTCO|nr:unnamed protein product [Mytilus coruscus]